MNKYNFSIIGEYHIGLARQIWIMEPVSKSHRVNHLANKDFWFSVF